MVHKFYAIKDEAAIKKGTIISTIFAIVVSCGSYFLGGFDRLFCTTDPEIATQTGKVLIDINNGKPDFDAMMPSLLENTMPLIMIGLVVVLVLSASMSTLSALVLTSSSTLTIDLIKPSYKKEMTDKKEMFIMRLLIAVFLIISVIIALNKNSYISTLMSISWGALAGSFLGPFTYGLFSKKITKASVWASFITGIGITVTHMFLFSLNLFPDLARKAAEINSGILSPINAGAFAMIVSLIIVPVVSAFTPKMERKTIDEIFSCYDKEKSNA
jgi:SSS family solute:Na+ symporter